MDFLSTLFSPVVLGLIAGGIAVLAIILWVFSRIQVAVPSEAIIISGNSKKNDAKAPEAARVQEYNDDGTPVLDAEGQPVYLDEGVPTGAQRVIIGGRAFVWPKIQEFFRISLQQYQTDFNVAAPDKNYITMAINGVVHFKVTGDVDGVRRAAERFPQVFDGRLKADEARQLFQTIIRSSVQGHVRSIIGERTFEEISGDRKSFMDAVIRVVSSDLRNQGITVEVLNIDEINTPGSTYLTDLSRVRAAEVARAAELREIDKEKEVAVNRINAEQEVAERDRELSLRKSEIKADTDSAAAKADAAGQLVKAEQDRLVAELERQALAEQANVEQEKLDIEIRKPAEARAYAEVQDANAKRDASNAEAEADAYRRTKVAEANKIAAVQDAEALAAAVKLDGEARGAAILAEGTARATIIEQEGVASAKAVEARATALNLYSDGAIAQEALKVSPEIAATIAAALGNVGNISIISNDGNGIGSLAGSIAKTTAEVPEVIKNLTGIDLMGMLSGYVGGKAAGASSQPTSGDEGTVFAAAAEKIADAVIEKKTAARKTAAPTSFPGDAEAE